METVNKRGHWSGERIARLGFLIGLGWDAKRIARDFIIHSTPANIYRQAQKFGLSFLAANVLGAPVSEKSLVTFDLAANRRGLSREGLVRLLVQTIAQEPLLIDNILDDAEDFPVLKTNDALLETN